MWAHWGQCCSTICAFPLDYKSVPVACSAKVALVADEADDAEAVDEIVEHADEVIVEDASEVQVGPRKGILVVNFPCTAAL